MLEVNTSFDTQTEKSVSRTFAFSASALGGDNRFKAHAFLPRGEDGRHYHHHQGQSSSSSHLQRVGTSDSPEIGPQSLQHLITTNRSMGLEDKKSYICMLLEDTKHDRITTLLLRYRFAAIRARDGSRHIRVRSNTSGGGGVELGTQVLQVVAINGYPVVNRNANIAQPKFESQMK
ncbi:hypothetical protein ACTXT7_015349 [Hymenolepis weldensis]